MTILSKKVDPGFEIPKALLVTFEMHNGVLIRTAATHWYLLSNTVIKRVSPVTLSEVNVRDPFRS